MLRDIRPLVGRVAGADENRAQLAAVVALGAFDAASGAGVVVRVVGDSHALFLGKVTVPSMCTSVPWSIFR